MNNLGDLPAEIVTLIVEQLISPQDFYACTLLNKQFYTVTNPFLWHTVVIRNKTVLLKVISGVVETSSSSAQLGYYIREIEFGSYVSDVSDATLLLLVIHLPCLEHLKIARGNRITDASLQYVPQYCPHLQSLCLEDSSMMRRTLEAWGLHCHDLTRLELENCSGVSFYVFHAVASCPLEILKITFSVLHLDSRTGTGNEYFNAAFVLGGFHRLRHLSIFDAGHHFIQHLIHIHANNKNDGIVWPDLVDLYLNNCNAIDDRSMITFVQSHPHLQCLGLSENTFSDAVLDAMATFLPEMRLLDLRASEHITHRGIRRLVQQCPSLTFIALHECGMTTHEFPELRADRCHGHGYVMGILQHITEQQQQPRLQWIYSFALMIAKMMIGETFHLAHTHLLGMVVARSYIGGLVSLSGMKESVLLCRVQCHHGTLCLCEPGFGS
ncbi:hypothetical protein BCR42DRAFT_456131 [Absidia repens]|uniref:F-box domain-containing protein n=1 Tax=Absidia repens TaxID=90262 RepID=A0A1X2I1A9_9FUNG|nr:hypothetical protein BCR42DRAFT_456131 [Absidia repens]